MAVTTPERTEPVEATPQTARRSALARWVRAAAVLMVLTQVVVRWRLVTGREYYGDDLRVLYLADTHSLFDPSYLFYDYDGHFMPGGFLLAGVVERLAPLDWSGAAASLVVMQLLASLALLRLLRVLLGDRPLMLAPLAFGLFSPLTLGSFTWWASALNNMPLQIGATVFVTEAILLVRTGARRHAVLGTAALALTYLFYIKTVLVPPLGFAVAVLVLMREGHRRSLFVALRRGWVLWLGAFVVTAAWALAYLGTRTEEAAERGDVDDVLLTIRTGFRVMGAAVLGGPSDWVNSRPGSPYAPVELRTAVIGGLLVLAVFLWTCVRHRGALLVWAVLVVEIAAGLFLAGVGRGSLGLGAFTPLACRYYAVEAVLLPLTAALLLTLPNRSGTRRTAWPWWAGLPVAAATVAFVAVALTSTADLLRAWQVDRTGAWLETARDSLAAAGPAPLLDQTAPADVVPPLAYPNNLVSRLFSPFPDRAEFEDWTWDLRLFDESGRLVPAQVVPGPAVIEGPVPGCGWPAAPDAGSTVPLQGPLPASDWTARLDYTADRDGEISVALGSGDAVRAPVRQGTGTLYLRLPGEGASLQVTTATAGLGVCVRSGLVGDVAPI
ncbi:hypothetical protein [Blastococcus sp. TF02A-26]|uniref:hypothetical protein n=1 Tax=Blastococcus sp. TF02A-26 TaxID=2250577 RepID=UPI000DE93E79|nr:hypothetical protein [Blastococcus sp. TF02A-26]RBY85977.1 hypothetical protein DQ240_11440 [Blastococcus sp. TF02A-26]